MTLLLVVHLVATCYMAGVIWMVQLVHYPMMGKVGQTFDECQQFHTSRMGILVGPPMLVELATAVLQVLRNPGEPVWIVGLTLLAIIWISTFVIQVPRHNQLSCGFKPQVHASLVRTNWLRTVLWTARALLVASAATAA